jgi:hypothetical protein
VQHQLEEQAANSSFSDYGGASASKIENANVAVIWSGKSEVPELIQYCLALSWVVLLASVPFILPAIDHRPVTKVQVIMAGCSMSVLMGGFFLFTHIILFKSAHFETERPLTVVECIYFMAQVVTTVGYGDIGPAKPRGQIFVGCYVIFSLFVLAMVTEDFVEHVLRVAKEYRRKQIQEEERSARGGTSEVEVGHLIAPEKPNLQPLLEAIAAFAFFDVTFILFFYLYPGENKAFGEAVYMSLITLGTVGFGFITPVTEGGMVFLAFWMVFGCSSMVRVIGEFTSFVYRLNEYERYHKAQGKLDAMKSLKKLIGDGDTVNSTQFLMFCLMESKKVEKDDLDYFLNAFHRLCPKDGVLDLKTVQLATTPRCMEIH